MPVVHRMLLTAALLVQASVTWGQSGDAMNWQTDLDAARATAEREQKLLLVHFYTDSCGPCRMLDATVFNQPNVSAAIATNYVPVKLNANEFQATAERFGITRVPTDVVITPQGRVLERTVSPSTPMEYIGRMSGVAQQYRQQAGRNFQTAAASTGSQPLNSAYAALSVPSADANAFTAANQPATGATANPYANPAMTGVATPAYGAQSSAPPTVASEPATTPVAVTNPYTQPSGAPSTNNRYADVAATPEVQQPAVTSSNNRYAAVAASPTPQQQAEALQPTPPAVAATPQLPAGSFPLGFFGYCPVTMKTENRWQKGDVRFGCYHRGRTYLFESAEKRDEFQAHGDEYAPALSGIDPVLAIDGNQVEPGKQEFGIEYEGQFYLFSSEENLRKFWSNASHYANGVRQAMNAAPDGPVRR